MTWLEDADHQHMSGVYFEEDDTDPVEGLAAIFRPLLSSPIGRQRWSQTAEELTTPSLYTKITKIMAQWDISED